MTHRYNFEDILCIPLNFFLPQKKHYNSLRDVAIIVYSCLIITSTGKIPVQSGYRVLSLDNYDTMRVKSPTDGRNKP